MEGAVDGEAGVLRVLARRGRRRHLQVFHDLTFPKQLTARGKESHVQLKTADAV